MADGFVSFMSIPTTEAEEGVKGPEYSGRTENVVPISRIKEMGLPATRKVTLGSAVVLVMAGAPWDPCFRCGKEGHRVRLGPNPQPPPGPCPFCKKIGHWKVDCPLASSRGTRLPSSVEEAAPEFIVPDLLCLATED